MANQVDLTIMISLNKENKHDMFTYPVCVFELFYVACTLAMLIFWKKSPKEMKSLNPSFVRFEPKIVIVL